MEMEARHWFSREREGHVLIIVTGGHQNTWNEIRNQLLPLTLQERLVNEPLWIQLQHRRKLLREMKSGGPVYGVACRASADSLSRIAVK
jgi:hypothetical protein